MWVDFLRCLKCYPRTINSLQTGCNPDEIAVAESVMHLSMPPELTAIYLANDGQHPNSDGIFKAVSGYDKYSRPLFLSLSSAMNIWNQLYHEKVDVFQPSDFPFAASYYDRSKLDDVFCVDTLTGCVYLLWVACFDPFLPEDWQTARLHRAETFNDFLHDQINMYG